MKTYLAAAIALSPAMAAAHEMGAHHAHPHIDPLLIVAAVAVLGVAVIAIWRGDRSG